MSSSASRTSGCSPRSSKLGAAGSAGSAGAAGVASVGSPVAPTEAIAAAETPTEPKPPSFDDLGLHPDVKLALDDMGYYAPTPVQTAVFRPVTDGKDVMVQSRTGTGKTTAFGLPIVNKLVPAHRHPQDQKSRSRRASMT